MKRHRVLRDVVQLVTYLLAGRLAAQQPDSTPKDTAALPPIVVSGSRLPNVRELARGLTGRTAVLSSRDLDARGVRSLADALEQLPGVTTSDELGARGQLDVALRGFQVSPVAGLPQGVTVYVDGVRANEPIAHEVNFDLLPLEDVDRVEVVYGPSVLLGRNSLGAAVNLVTRRGGAPGQGQLEVSGGGFGRAEVRVRAGAKAGVWDYYVGARFEREDGWRQQTESRIGTVFAKIGLLNHTWDATLSYSGADNRILQAGSLPESLYAANPRINFTGGDFFAPRAHLLTLNAQRRVGGAQLAVNLYGRALDAEQVNVNLASPNSRQRNRVRQGGGAAQLTGTVGLLGRPLRWITGVDAGMQGAAVRIYAVVSGGDSLTESARTDELDAGGFAGGQWEFAKGLSATLLGRYDYIHLPFTDFLDSGASGLNLFRHVSPRVALTWLAPAGQEVVASVSRGFRAPAVVEIACADPAAACALPFALGPDPVLRPVVATTYELGWHVRSGAGHLDASANVYRTNVRDDIFFVAPTVTRGYFRNIGATRRQGLEASVQWVGRGGHRAYVNYGYTIATFRTAAVLATTRDSAGETVVPGDRLPMVPAHRANVGGSIPIWRQQVRLGLDGRYVGRQFLRGDEANVTARLPDYALADASLESTLGRLEVRLMVRNVTGRRIATFGTWAENPMDPGSPVQRFLTPGQPRNVEVSVSAEF